MCVIVCVCVCVVKLIERLPHIDFTSRLCPRIQIHQVSTRFQVPGFRVRVCRVKGPGLTDDALFLASVAEYVRINHFASLSREILYCLSFRFQGQSDRVEGFRIYGLGGGQG